MIFRTTLVSFFLLLTANTAALAATSDVVGTCTVLCDQKLASCERVNGTKGKCPRKYQSCLDQCRAPLTPELRNRAQKKHDLCTQHCDLNSSLCLQANPKQLEQCRAGQLSCIERCE